LCRLRQSRLPDFASGIGSKAEGRALSLPGQSYAFAESARGIGRTIFAAETARPVFKPRNRPRILGYLSETGKRQFAVDCVVFEPV
jgi:hypothetical protein